MPGIPDRASSRVEKGDVVLRVMRRRVMPVRDQSLALSCDVCPHYAPPLSKGVETVLDRPEMTKIAQPPCQVYVGCTRRVMHQDTGSHPPPQGRDLTSDPCFLMREGVRALVS